MSAFHRTKRYTMKKDAASSTLAKVLSSVEKNNNTPIDKMLKKRVNAAKGYSRYLTAVKIMLAFTICVPLIFVFTANAKGVDTKADITLEKGLFSNRAAFFEEVFGIKPVIRQKKML